MKHMQRLGAKSQAVTLALLCFFAAVGYGAEPTTMATLRWTGDGEFMSWRWEKLDEPFGDGAARFAAESRSEGCIASKITDKGCVETHL